MCACGFVQPNWPPRCVHCLQALRAIASKLEDCPDMFTSAVHSQAIDFLINRLPPHPKQLPARGPAPSMDDSVWCRVAGWCYLLPFEMTGMSCEDENEAGGVGQPVLGSHHRFPLSQYQCSKACAVFHSSVYKRHVPGHMLSIKAVVGHQHTIITLVPVAAPQPQHT